MARLREHTSEEIEMAAQALVKLVAEFRRTPPEDGLTIDTSSEHVDRYGRPARFDVDIVAVTRRTVVTINWDPEPYPKGPRQ